MKKIRTIVDAYNHLVNECYYGDSMFYQYPQRGSFANESTYRIQLPPLILCILEPTNFLYLPKTVTRGTIEKYYENYLLGMEEQENEAYTYGSRIASQLPAILEMLEETPTTHQMAISISTVKDICLKKPPCLRELTLQVRHGELHLTSFWRSNDIKEAFLINQGGLGLFLEDLANYAKLKRGYHYYVSSGSHIDVRENECLKK
jgi:thymidylate synthase